MKRLFVQPELCTGCKSCQLACAVEHSRSKNLLGAMLEEYPPHARLYVEAVFTAPFTVLKMPLTCRHCDPAPCMAACLPQAMHRTSQGVVTNVGGQHACIACGMCIMLCPFGMIGRGADPGGKVMALKCDLCPEREQPACAAACPTGAIRYLSGDDFAQHTRARASALLAGAHQVQYAALSRAQEEE